MIRTLAWALTLLFVTTAVTAQEYTVQRGDTLNIEILEDPSLNRQILVLPDGRFNFPFVGSISAAGETVSSIQANLTSALAPNFASQPTVFVNLASLNPQTGTQTVDPEEVIFVYFLGEVNVPGRTPVVEGTTLLQALAIGGGLTDFAATKRIQLRRLGTDGQEVIYRFDYKAISEGAQITGATTVVDGDVILVPQRRLFE